MMKYLFLKQLRDLKKGVVRNIAIFIITALSLFFFSGLNSVGRNIRSAVNEFYLRQNLADYTVMSKFSIEEFEKIRDEISADGAITFDAVSMQVGSVNRNIEVSLYPYSDFPVNTPDLTQGVIPSSYFDALIDTAFATSNGIKAGDTLNVNIEGTSWPVKITGLARFPESLYKGAEIPQIAETGLLKIYVDKNLFTDTNSNTEIDELYIKSQLGKEELREKLFQITGKSMKNALITDRSENVSVMRVRSDIELINSLMNVLPLVCLIALCLILYVNMSKRIEDESYNIGIMSANGLARSKIAFSYILPYLLLVTAGAVVGIAVGVSVLPPLYIGLLQQFYTLPPVPHAGLAFSIIVPLTVVVTVTVLSMLLAIIGTMLKMPNVLMRGSSRKSIKFTGSAKLPITLKLSLRNFISYRKKTILTIISVSLCLGLLLTSFLLDNSVSNLQNELYGKYYDFDAKISWNMGDRLSYDEVEDYVLSSGIFDDVKFCIEVPATVNGKNTIVSVVDGADPCFDIYNNESELNGEGAYVPSSFGDIDKVTITVYFDEPFELELPVVGTYKDIGVLGVIIPLSAVQKNVPLLYSLIMQNLSLRTKLYANKKGDGDVDEFMNSLSTHFGAAFLYEDFGINSQRYKQLFLVIDVTENLLFAVCGAIMILLIINISCLSISDRVKDYTIFKALGIDARKINIINSLENYFSVFIAYLLSFPVGILISQTIIKAVTRITGVVVYMHLYFLSALVLFAGATLFTLLGNILINIKISKVNIAKLLKLKE